MEVRLRTSVDVQSDWPEHTGVDGLSRRASRTAIDRASAEQAIAELRAWLPGFDSGRNPASLVESLRPDRFPYAEVLVHYQRVGRAHADARLVNRLRYLNDLVRKQQLTEVHRLWPLPEWLPSTVDQRTGNYDSYMVANLLEGLTFVVDGGEDRTITEVENAADRAIDMLIAGLVADLALIEADAMRAGPAGREQRRRTQACLLVLSRLPGLTPKLTGRPDTCIPAAAGVLPPSERLVEATSMIAQCVRRALPTPCRQAINLSLLPTTRLHDEQMFIRCIQIFETMYRQVYRCLVRASAAMQFMDVKRACAELTDAADRLGTSSTLYRVVTTMPKPAFAIIREYTDGRSAIQSRSYRQIHLVCAPRQPSPAADKMPAVDVTSPTLQETFQAIAGRIHPADRDRLAARMRALDAAWRAMKRTHWGITLKIIGSAPGTGGTSGADYLKRAADVPLFPALVDAR